MDRKEYVQVLERRHAAISTLARHCLELMSDGLVFLVVPGRVKAVRQGWGKDRQINREGWQDVLS